MSARWYMHDLATCSKVRHKSPRTSLEAHLARNHFNLKYTSYLLPLEWVADTQQQSRLFHIVVLVAQDANTTWLHHQIEREGQVVAQPSLGKCSGSVAMRDQDDVLRFVVMHMRCLDLADLPNQFIEARRQFCRGSGRSSVVIQEALVTVEAVLLSAFTPVSPDVPFLVLVEPTFLAQSSDVFGNATFIVTGSKGQLLAYSA
jgi:hypothetical protein